jgi:predicted ArsR family transcriptional regulator
MSLGPPASAESAGSPALPALDPVIHAQPRLRVTVTLATLASGDRITFPRLQELVGMTAGNLATHLKKLEDAGYVRVTKAYRGRTPVTWLSLTTAGRLALEEYTAALQALLTKASPDPAHHDPAHHDPAHHDQQDATP